jgi:hypothetical protein
MKKFLSVVLLLFLLFSSSCQKKQNQITFDVRFELGYGDTWKEKALIQESGVVITLDWDDYKLGKATQEQFDFLKQKQVPIYRKWEWIPVEKEKDEKPNRYFTKYVPDAFKDIDQLLVEFNKENNCREFYHKTRLYRDLNQDNIPELFIATLGGTGGFCYVVYQIKKEGYQRIGYVPFSLLQVLSTKHNGFCDLMIYSKLNSPSGHLYIYEFNGNEYEKVKKMMVIYKDMIDENIFIFEKDLKLEHFDPKWSSKDDDKYRSMIK